MLSFIKRTFLFLVIIPIFYSIYYIGFDYYYNVKNDKKAVYIWGDSQTYRGIDIQVLKESTNKNIYNYAKHGAGVYDLLVIVKKIPNNSTVVLGVSKLVQLRNKKSDRNRSGFSITALLKLYSNNYTLKELKRIIQNNKIPSKILQEKTDMYQYNDSVIFTEPIDLFEKIYAKVPHFLSDKQNLYKIGIEALRAKKCNIIFVDFPYHPLLEKVENKSAIKFQTEAFTKEIINSSKDITLDTFNFDAKKNIMYDLTHLNVVGAGEFTSYLSRQINNYLERDSVKKNQAFEVYCRLKNKG